MKNILKFLFALSIFLLSNLNAQNPCSGVPGANSITPLSQTICAGSNAFMALTNTYSNSGITFQWQNSSVSMVGPWTNISGATEPGYATPTLATTMFYNVIITCTNSNQSISIPYSVTVITCTTPCQGAPASNTILPLNHTLCIGNAAAMGLANNYTTTGMTYQWGSASGPAGPYTAIPGATLNAYTSPTLSSNMYYNLVVTCANSSLSFSTTHSVSVVSCTFCSGAPGANTVLPLQHSVCAGSSASLSLANSYSTSGITYQWQGSGISPVGPFSAINGATLSTYNSGPLNATAYYNVLITCTNSGQFISVPHTVTVVACNAPCTGSPPATSIVPSSNTICAGSAASLSLSTTYTSTGINYQWASSTSQGGPFSAIPGATTSAFTTPTLNTNMFYNVVITCTNSNLSYTATQAISVVSCTYCSGLPTSNTVLPVSQTICAGGSAAMSLANSYTSSGIIYQWQSSTLSLSGPFTNISGATAPSYTSLPLNTTTYFNVVITCTNSGQSVSVPHMVTVVSCTSQCTGVPSANTIVPVSPTLCSGNSVALSLANFYQATGLTYQWGVASTPGGPYTAIPGATLNNYSTPPLMINGYYSIVITCTNSSSSYSTTQVVNVVNCNNCSGPPSTNSIIPFSYTLCSGSSASLSLANSYSQSGISYQWQSSANSAGPFAPVSGATSSTYITPPLTGNTHYNAVITCAGNGSITTGVLSVLVYTCSNSVLEEATDLYDLSVSPNPNKGEFVVWRKQKSFCEVTIFDVLGRPVLSTICNPGKTIIDISSMPDGIYYAHFRTASSVRVLKVLKE